MHRNGDSAIFFAFVVMEKELFFSTLNGIAVSSPYMPSMPVVLGLTETKLENCRNPKKVTLLPKKSTDMAILSHVLSVRALTSQLYLLQYINEKYPSTRCPTAMHTIKNNKMRERKTSGLFL